MLGRLGALAGSLLILTLAATLAQAVEGDEHWSSAFALPGADGAVYSALEFGGDLIVGGEFRHIGTCQLEHVARWDGSNWHAMGDGFDGWVMALAEHNGELYAGGYFTLSGTTPVQAVARWDGEAWQPLSPQLPYYGIHAFTTYDGRLIAGGIAAWDSYEGEGYEVAALAAWDGNGWTPLLEFQWGLWSRINALAVFEGRLIIAGMFEVLEEDLYLNGGVARWDGSTWETMGDVYWLTDLLEKDGTLYAADGWVLRWEGTDWFVEAGVPNGGISSLATWGDDIVAGGTFTQAGGHAVGGIAGWDGTSWYTIGDPLAYAGESAPRVEVETLIDYAGHLVVGGNFMQAGARSVPRLAAFEGAEWSPLVDAADAAFLNGLDRGPYAMARIGDAIAVGGVFDYSADTALNGVGLWDGAQWLPLGTGLANRSDVIYSACEYQGGLAVSGSFQAISGVSSPNLAHWDGAEWQALGGGLAPVAGTLLADGPRLYLAGYFTSAGGQAAGNIACWDGAAWSNLAGGLNGDVTELALHEGELIAAGAFTATTSGQPLLRIARWDGEAWQPMGSGFPAPVQALAHWDGRLVAGGYFTSVGGQATPYLATWDGQAWQPFANGPDYRVDELASYHGDLIVSGDFESVAGLPMNAIARWDGTTWSTLGTGFTNSDFWGFMYIRGLSVLGDQLYVVGSFRNAGDKASYGIACWTDGSTAVDPGPAAAAPLSTWNFPNPFNPSTEIVFTLPAPAPVTLRIVDASGRRVRTLLEGSPRPAGEQRVTWDGRDDAGRRVGSGVYLTSIEADGRTAQRKLVLLK